MNLGDFLLNDKTVDLTSAPRFRNLIDELGLTPFLLGLMRFTQKSNYRACLGDIYNRRGEKIAIGELEISNIEADPVTGVIRAQVDCPWLKEGFVFPRCKINPRKGCVEIDGWDFILNR